jgi:hypothetical protein
MRNRKKGNMPENDHREVREWQNSKHAKFRGTELEVSMSQGRQQRVLHHSDELLELCVFVPSVEFSFDGFSGPNNQRGMWVFFPTEKGATKTLLGISIRR